MAPPSWSNFAMPNATLTLFYKETDKNYAIWADLK